MLFGCHAPLHTVPPGDAHATCQETKNAFAKVKILKAQHKLCVIMFQLYRRACIAVEFFQ